MDTTSVFFLVALAFGVVIFSWAVFDINRRTFKTESDRRYWVNLIYFLPLFGALYYLYSKNKKKNRV